MGQHPAPELGDAPRGDAPSPAVGGTQGDAGMGMQGFRDAPKGAGGSCLRAAHPKLGTGFGHPHA